MDEKWGHSVPPGDFVFRLPTGPIQVNDIEIIEAIRMKYHTKLNLRAELFKIHETKAE